MKTVEPLRASWQVQARGPVPAGLAGALSGPLTAAVPGCVHTDLIAAGLVDDLAVRGTEADQDWVQEVDWTYTAHVDARAEGAHRELVLEGLDTLATVSIDGTPVLTSSDMFHRHVLDLSSFPDTFELQVDFRAAMPEARRREAERGTLPRPYWFPYNYLRKMACSFGWDWGPTTVTCGVWKPVLLQTWDVARLDEVDVRARLVDGVPTLDVAVTAVGDTEGLVAVVDLAGRAQRVELGGGRGSVRLQDESLALWWPRGYGEPHLHAVTVMLLGPDGATLDSDVRRVGFRSVELDQTPDAEGSSFALVVNGRRVWVRGFDWIPDDIYPTRVDRDRYADRVGHALAAGANFLRVWGGGIVESDDFYDLCDEQGVLVWQDFLFACAAYDEDEQTVAEVREEVAQAVRRLRHRASLALWCGGNECLEGHEHWGWEPVLDGRPWGLQYYTELIPGRLAELDGTRPYIPGSPFSPGGDGDPRDSREGTVHIWTTWGQVDYEYYELYRPRFVAEFGYQAPASWPTLTRATGTDQLDPRSPLLQTHQKALGEDKLELGLVRHFPDPVTDPRAWYFAAQLLQARAVRVGIPHFRSQYERCSGTVWWQLNDCWPALSWAVLDVAGERRLGWHAMRDAYADRLAVLSALPDDVRLTLVNDSDEEWTATAVVRHVHVDGHVIAEGKADVSLAPRSAHRLGVSALTGRRVDASVEEVVVVDVPGAPRATRASRPDRAFGLRGQDVEVGTEPRPDGSVAVEVTARTLVRDLCLLAELRGFGYRVDGQLATLGAADRHTFLVSRADGPVDLASLGDVTDLLWSENRVRETAAV